MALCARYNSAAMIHWFLRMTAIGLLCTLVYIITVTPREQSYNYVKSKKEVEKRSTENESTCDETPRTDDLDIIQARSFQRTKRLFFYNRVPKCASRAIINVVQQLPKMKLLRYELYDQYHHTFAEQRNITKRFDLAPPAFFEGHIAFINFESFGRKNPIYINVVREPLDRFLSMFYFRRTARQYTDLKLIKSQFTRRDLEILDMDVTECLKMNIPECGMKDKATGTMWIYGSLPFFIGQAVMGADLTSDHLAVAKRNVEKYYAVVGINEDLKSFFEVMGGLFPEPFKTATDIYTEMEESLYNLTKTPQKTGIGDFTVSTLKFRLRFEYDFYYFIKSRFYRLHCYVKSLQHH